MRIEWNKVTRFSRMASFVCFIVLPFVGFYLGYVYGKASATFVTVSIGNPVSARGTFVFGGVLCRRFQANDGHYYTLTGDRTLIDYFKDGKFVEVRGSLVEASYCQQDTTIKVSEIKPL